MVIAKPDEQYASAAFELISREFVELNIIHKALETQLDDHKYRFFTEFHNTLKKEHPWLRLTH